MDQKPFPLIFRENSAPTPNSFTFCCACGTMMGASSWPVNTSSLFPTLNTVDLFFREGLKKNPLPPPAPLLPAASSAPSRSSLQCCGIVKNSSGSGSDFFTVMVPVPTFEILTVPVPAPYLDHKKQIFQKKFLEKILPFYIASLSFIKFIVQCA
jgi:hypothetical protein